MHWSNIDSDVFDQLSTLCPGVRLLHLQHIRKYIVVPQLVRAFPDLTHFLCHEVNLIEAHTEDLSTPSSTAWFRCLSTDLPRLKSLQLALSPIFAEWEVDL